VIVSPFAVDTDHDTVALWSPLVAVGCDGADGTPAGTTGVEAAEGGLVPTPLWATTVKVYVVPFVSVPMAQLSVDSVAGEHIPSPGAAVTV
jgi:hypothetical protein